MDSALLHARSLFEFFTSTESAIQRNNQKGLKRLTWRDYGADTRQESQMYKKDFMKALHGRVMHLDKDRAGYDEIKHEVVNLANDVLKLWETFSAKPEAVEYAGVLDKCRRDALEEARKVAKQYEEYGYKSPLT